MNQLVAFNLDGLANIQRILIFAPFADWRFRGRR